MVDLGQEIYNGSAALGRITTFIGLIVGILIGTGLLIASVYLLVTKGKYTEPANAKVSRASCNSGTETNCTGEKNNQNCVTRNVVNCKANVIYQAANAEQNADITVRQALPLQKGDTLTIYYDKKIPSEASASKFPRTALGIVLLVFAILIIGSSVLWFYITRINKFAAAAQGVGTGIQVVKQAIN